MIFLQILLFFVSIIFLSLAIAGYGALANFKIKNDFFLNVFLGLILISFLITVIHFFVKIDLKVSFLIFVIGIFIFIKKNKFDYLALFKRRNIQFLIIIIFLIPMYISQKYHEDFGYYHLPYAIAFLEEKIIFGFANINPSYVYNSIWLNLNSFFFLMIKILIFYHYQAIYFIFHLFSFLYKMS